MSALDTLLEAARYIEQQEQRQTLFSPSSSPPFVVSSGVAAATGRFYYENGTNNNNNSSTASALRINNSSNNSRHSINQVSSPPISPASFAITNGNNNHTGNNHEFAEYNNGSVVSNSGRAAVVANGRIEEPFSNGHSVTSPYQLIPTPTTTKQHTNNDNDIHSTVMQCDDDADDGGGTVAVIDNQNKSNINYTINHSYHSNNDDKNTTSILNSLSLNSIPITRKKFVPLTPPPISSRKLCESSRIRSFSLSSNKITANGNNKGATSTPFTSILKHNSNGGNIHNILSASTEDSSQSSLNLSSGYHSGGSVGGGSNLNLNGGNVTMMAGGGSMNNGDHHPHHQLNLHGQSGSGGRRRTTSTNSNGAGTREVHNKLEKHRRAHLKECFEQLKVQLQLKDEEKKKTSNLAILGAAYRHVVSLRNQERELEQQVEQLAKDKINAQKTITCLKRGLSAKLDNMDLSNIITDVENGNIPAERESLSDSISLSSGRGSMRYSSSSSLSSGGNTISSPLGAGMQSAMPNNMSPVISSTSFSTSPSSPNQKLSSSPLSLTAKNISATSLTRGSPTPSTPSPSPSSSGVSSSSSIMSSSPPNGIGLKVPNIPNGLKLANGGSPPKNGILISATTGNGIINLAPSDANCIAISTATGLPLNLNASQTMHIHSPKDMTNHSSSMSKNGISRKVTSIAEPRDGSLASQVIYSKNNSNYGCVKDVVMEEGEQPAKVIKVLNGYALASVDKDNKILSSAPLSLSQVNGGLVVSQFPMQGLRVIGPNGLATIELSSANVQSQSRCFTQTVSPPVTTCASNGAQLHKLLVNGVNGTTEHGASELGRLPGGAELNILPTVTNGTMYRGSSKLAILNNGISLKGTDVSPSNGRALHLVTPLQSGHGLTPIVVSQGQSVNNLAHIIASPQLAGKVNLSMGGQAVPLLNTQYLGPIKPMVVVASNANPTFSSVPPIQTTATIATGTTNGNAS